MSKLSLYNIYATPQDMYTSTAPEKKKKKKEGRIKQLSEYNLKQRNAMKMTKKFKDKE